MSELLKLISRGEGKSLELKKEMPSNQNIAKAAVAFSNMAGGKIIIGIEDKTGKIVGISDKDILNLPDKISNIIYDSCSPAILPEIYVAKAINKNLLVVEIFPGNLKPYYIKSAGCENGTFVRVGATNKPADGEMIHELERQRLNISFDEQAMGDRAEKDLDLQKLKADFKILTGKSLKAGDLLTLKLIKDHNGKMVPTYGGLMLAGKKEYFEQARIKCARFKGSDVKIFIDQKDFSGPLYSQVENAMNFARTHIALSGQLNGIQRVDRYAVPIEAIREAIINAVVHRDYSISGSDIKFAIFDDRIEITSPGQLPRSLEIDDLESGRSEIRNKVIARFFREIKFIEQWGTGIIKMIDYCREAGLKSPEFKENGLFLKVVFYKTAAVRTAKAGGQIKWSDKVVRNSGQIGGQKQPAEGNGRSSEILGLIKANPYISRKELVEKLGINGSAIQKYIVKLKAAGIIERVGPDRGGYWRIVK